MNARRLPPAIVALTPGDLAAGDLPRCLVAIARAARGGLRGVLVREPLLGDRATLEFALAVRARLGESAWVGLHDRVHLAREARADAVHLGFRSLPPPEARRVLGDELAIGFSAHETDLERTDLAADYLVFGPVLDTPSKRGLVAPVGFEGLRRACERRPEPVWALGGLRAEHVVEVAAAGARGTFARAAILGTTDPESAARSFADALASGAREARPE